MEEGPAHDRPSPHSDGQPANLDLNEILLPILATETRKGKSVENMIGDGGGLLKTLHTIIRFFVKILAIIMTLVICLGVVDVGWIIVQKLMQEPRYILTMSDILATFGAFMAVLIAIEIFYNIVLYLRDDVIHVKIVMATALMAIARKVIILDFSTIGSDYVYAIALVVLSMSAGFWIVHRFQNEDQSTFSFAKKRLKTSKPEPSQG